MLTTSAEPARVSAVAGESGKRVRRPPRQYKCEYCAKIFKRSEHCIRHERSHTREKPFSCRYCRKTYSRKDLVTRHERTLHADVSKRAIQNPTEEPEESPEASPSERDEDEILQRPGVNIRLSRHAPPSPANENEIEMESEMPPEHPDQRRGSCVSTTASGSEIIVANGTMDADITMGENAQSMPQEESIPTPPSLPSASITDPYQTTSLEALPAELLGDGFEVYNHDPNFSMHFNEDHHPQQQNGDPQRSMNQPDMASLNFSPLPDGMFQFTPDIALLDMQDWTQSVNLGPNNAPDLVNGFAHFDATDSHFTSTVEPQNNLPLIRKEKRPPTPTFIVDDATHASIQKDLNERLISPGAAHAIPSRKICQGFLSSYVECFNGHLPIIHLHTLCLKTTPSPLFLAMCGIGALYRLDRRRAGRLFDTATQAIGPIPASCKRGAPPMEDFPLWLVQAKLLLTFYAMLGGDGDLASSTVSEIGVFTLIYERTRLSLLDKDTDLDNITWTHWIQRESWKRVLGGIYIMSTLGMVIYDVNPGFNATRDLDIETLSDEGIWNSASANEWRELRSNHTKQDSRTLSDAAADVMSENTQDSSTRPYVLSPFSALLVMHAIVVHMRQLLQVAQAFARDSFTAMPGRDMLGASLLDAALRSLARCEKLLNHKPSEGDHGWDDPMETPLVFNCQAILRIAYIRLFNGALGFNRLSLMDADPGTVEVAVSMFATKRLERSPSLLTAVTKSFEGFCTPVKMGHMLIRKTAAFRWSVEHAIAGWDCALIVTKWVHSVEIDRLNAIEPSPAESEFLVSMNSVLEEADYDFSESKSLAAGLARTWSMFLQDSPLREGRFCINKDEAESEMNTFEYVGTTHRVVFGSGTLQQLPLELQKMKAKAVLVLSTPEQTSLAETVRGIIGTTCAAIFSEATMHTPTNVTEKALSMASNHNIDGIVSVGGGSTIGLGKAISVRTGLPHLCIPTTYAGSEMTPILGETEGRRKVTRRDAKILPPSVLYDVDLSKTLPIGLTVHSGINAIAHAVEALYSANTNPIIDLMACEGIRSLCEALPILQADASNDEARYKALYGAWLCGMCLGSVDMALHHKLCHTLGGTFNLPHAQTHVIVLPHALAYNSTATPRAMKRLADALPDSNGDAVRGINILYQRLEINLSLKDLGMPESGIDEAADVAISNPYKNPRDLDGKAIRELIRRAWAGEKAVADL
ncbi:Maleylacetate reductase [Neonectria ditissima]|uniref:Maleylacetate reductase n=1 Tax=Neonectria ditissima TaxID=78410 RepID=A0A0P7B236_9HYPO|nr:Maleylacetate reductase [Neonectria ditissima]